MVTLLLTYGLEEVKPGEIAAIRAEKSKVVHKDSLKTTSNSYSHEKWVILKAKKIRYLKIFIICVICVAMGICFEHSGFVPIMVLGGFVAACRVFFLNMVKE